MSRSPVVSGRSVLTLAAGLFTMATVAVAAPASDGWQSLWRNQNADARVKFRAALKQNPSDPAALRGLGILSLQEDAEVAAMQAWRPLFRAAPSHWSAAAYWPRFVELAVETGRWTLVDEAARDLVAAKGVAPELRASARVALAAAADRAGKAAEADKLRASLGYVRQWRVIGPFDNVSLSGFDKAYAPEREIDFGKSYPGKDDQALRWHRLATVSREGACGVGQSLGDEGANVYYAATALSSPQEQAVVLRFDPTGASKIFVNGRLVFTDDKYRVRQSLVPDAFRAPAKLRKGWNTVLVKLADNEEEHGEFALRVTGPSGAELLGVPADPAHAATPTAIDAGPAPAPAEPAWVAAVRASAPSDDPEASAALGYLLRKSPDLPAAADAYRKALTQAPNAGWLNWELARTLLDDGQADDSRASRDLARQQNPRLVLAELAYLSDEQRALSPPERITRLKMLQRISPSSAAVHWSLAYAYREAEMNAEAVTAARTAANLSPGAAYVERMARVYQAENRQAEAEKLLVTALAAAPDSPELLYARAEMLAEQGKIPAATAMYQRLLRVGIPDPDYWTELAALYQGSGNPKQAVATLRAARERRPQDASLHAALADLLREMGQTKEAVALYTSAIRIDPSQVALRDKLRLLTGEQPVVQLAPETPVKPILAKTPTAKEMPGVSAAVLLDEARHVVYPDYATVTRFRQIVKVFDAAGVERFSTFPVSTPTQSANATVESARLIKADGKVQNVDSGLGGAISFPSLAPGDVIDVAYRVEDYQRGGLARQFWSQWQFSGLDVPVKLSRYVLMTPPDMKFQTRSHGAVPEPTVQDLKGWRIREWRMTDVPPLKQEALGTAPTDAARWLDISSIGSWKQVVDWYQDLSAPRCVPDASVRAKAAELTRDAKTEEEKLRAIIGYVSSIQYQTTPFRLSAYVPTEGKQVLRDRYADCKDKAALLTALLASVGIKSEMVLLSGRSHGVVPYLPSPRFTHAIARVQTSKGPLWVDATADQMEYAGLPHEVQGVPALVVSDATEDLVLTPALPIEQNRMIETHTGMLAPDGKLTGSFALTAGGNWGWMMRSGLRLIPEASRDEALRGVAARLVENARYESGAMEQLEERDKPLVIRFKYEVPRHGSAAGNFLLARLPWGASSGGGVESLLSTSTREQDVEVGMLRGQYESTVRLELPAGYTPEDLKPEVRLDSEWGSFRVTYRMEGNVLHAKREMNLTPLRVPAADYPGLVKFLQAVEQETKKQLVFRKP